MKLESGQQPAVLTRLPLVLPSRFRFQRVLPALPLMLKSSRSYAVGYKIGYNSVYESTKMYRMHDTTAYINFVIATPNKLQLHRYLSAIFRVQPSSDNPPAHDSLNRLLHRLPAKIQRRCGPRHNPLSKCRPRDSGHRRISTLDKPYAQLVFRWSWSPATGQA